jgi:hypothetical protein
MISPKITNFVGPVPSLGEFFDRRLELFLIRSSLGFNPSSAVQ